MKATVKAWTHIIVGAGAAGCVLANQLTKNRNFNILLIEAGGTGKGDPTLKVPMMTSVLLRGKRHIWQYQTEKEQGLKGQNISLPRGKVLGGSTAINGMVYSRGLPIDYDHWSQLGLTKWSWDSVVPYFQKIEKYNGNNSSSSLGRSGSLSISDRQKPLSPLVDAFVDAGVTAGYPRCNDFNHPNAEGFGFYDFTIKNGHRESTATAYLESAKEQKNLTIKTNCEVNRVLFKNQKAFSLEVLCSGTMEQLRAEQEIILCAGAIGTPAILMRSGIGSADELNKLNIAVVVDSPEVGQNLHDHVLVRVSYKAPEAVTLHNLTRIDKASLAFIRSWLFGTGPMTVFPLEAGAFLRTKGDEFPSIQSHFLPALSTATLRFNPFKNNTNNISGFMANASVMRPFSRGFVKITGSSLKDPLRIVVNYLKDERDLNKLIEATDILRDVFSQKQFTNYRQEELSPGKNVKTRNELSEWVRGSAGTVHHLCGSCRMGIDLGSVVNPELQVRGVEGLRIADASVFPSITSGNTAAPSMLIGIKAAEFLMQ